MSKQEPFKWRKAKPTPDAPRKVEPAPARSTPAPSHPQPAARASETPSAAEPTAETPALSHDQIAVLAYEIWESRGRPDGGERDHWHEAERRLSSNERAT